MSCRERIRMFFGGIVILGIVVIVLVVMNWYDGTIPAYITETSVSASTSGAFEKDKDRWGFLEHIGVYRQAYVVSKDTGTRVTVDVFPGMEGEIFTNLQGCWISYFLVVDAPGVQIRDKSYSQGTYWDYYEVPCTLSEGRVVIVLNEKYLPKSTNVKVGAFVHSSIYNQKIVVEMVYNRQNLFVPDQIR